MISREALTTGSPFLCTEGTREDSRNATQKINQSFSESSETKALGLRSGGAGIRVSKCWVESLFHPGYPLAQGPACRGDMGRRGRGLLQCWGRRVPSTSHTHQVVKVEQGNTQRHEQV